jgi:hypothetical protein
LGMVLTEKVLGGNAMKTEWMRFVINCCSVAALVVLVIVALGPAGWQPRTGLGWQIEHFVGYFAFTLMFFLAWPPTVRGRGSPHGGRGAA